MKKTEKTNFACPVCGTKMQITEEVTTEVKVDKLKAEKPATIKFGSNKATERIEALKMAGVSVSNLFAINGANDGEYVGCLENGVIRIIADDDPIYAKLKESGTIPERRLFRRWIASQLMHFEANLKQFPQRFNSVNAIIQWKGYEYMWKMMEKELSDQVKLVAHGDMENFEKRNRWFNEEILWQMCANYIMALESVIKKLTPKRCKGRPYYRIPRYGDVFVDEVEMKILNPLRLMNSGIASASDVETLYCSFRHFRKTMVRLSWDTPQDKIWINAYKGMGAYATMENFILFSGCHLYSDAGVKLSLEESIKLLNQRAQKYAAHGEGWRMYAMFRKFLADNGINPSDKIAEWRRKFEK